MRYGILGVISMKIREVVLESCGRDCPMRIPPAARHTPGRVRLNLGALVSLRPFTPETAPFDVYATRPVYAARTD